MANKISPVNPLEKTFYYPALDGLRFFAFLIVFLHHSLLGISSNNPLVNYFLIIIQKNGWVGVDLFFVLSGFLITALLLRERAQFGEFSLKNFWIRRALRIWPLYFLAVFFGFFIAPHPSGPVYEQEIATQLPFYLIFLGNWAIVQNGYSHFLNISHLWTISLEEQFYFVWPLILMFSTSLKKTFLTGGVVIIGAIVTRFYLSLVYTQHPGIYTNTFARVDILTMGAVLSLILFYRPQLLNPLKKFISWQHQLIVLLFFSYLLYRIYLFDPDRILNVTFGFLIIGLFMVYFVYSAVQNGGLNKYLSYKPFVFLGKISYGLYIWHILAIDLSQNPIQGFLLTIFFGAVSYYLYEIRFLKLKTNFTKITSRSI